MNWMLSVLLVAMVTVTNGNRRCKMRSDQRSCNHRVVNGVIVVCDGDGTESTIPYNIDEQTKYMALQNFNLGHLSRESFAHLQHVECLTIIDSGVGTVDGDAFSAMESLKELVLQNTYMNNTQITFVTHGAFRPELLTIAESPSISTFNFDDLENLDQLKTLDIHGNSLKEMNGDLFDLVLNLEHLDVSENGMAGFDWSQLTKLQLLSRLNMHGNSFQTIPPEMERKFFAVKELTLANNPFHCNCKLSWLKDFYETAQDQELDYESVTCASPGQQKRMLQKDVAEFTCAEPSAPMIEWTKLDDGRFEVNCTSYGDPAPELTLTLPNGQRVIVAPSTDLSVLHTQSPHILMQPGLIQCDAINSEGAVWATEELPMPNVTASAGELVMSVLMLCLAVLLSSTYLD